MSQKKRIHNWNTPDTLSLIEVWKANVNELRGNKRNQHVYQKIASEMMEKGIKRSPQEVKTKIANLTADYRREKTKGSINSSLWKFWDAVHDVVGSSPPLDRTESSSDSQKQDKVEEEDDEDAAYNFSNVEVILTTPPSQFDLTKTMTNISSHGISPEPDSFDHRPVIENGHSSSLPRAGGRGETKSRSRKRKYHFEEQQLKLLRLIFEEHKRTNEMYCRAEEDMNALLREELDLHRQSLCIEERIAKTIESACCVLDDTTRNDDGGPIVNGHHSNEDSDVEDT